MVRIQPVPPDDAGHGVERLAGEQIDTFGRVVGDIGLVGGETHRGTAAGIGKLGIRSRAEFATPRENM